MFTPRSFGKTEENGETTITRYTLRELLDKLGEVTGPDDGQPGG